MKALLQFIPTIAAGLFAGWLLAPGMLAGDAIDGNTPGDGSAPLSAIPRANAAPQALREHLDSGSPLPPVPDPVEPGGSAYNAYLIEISAEFQRLRDIGSESPFRAQLHSELLRAQLPAQAAVWGGAGFPGGFPGAEQVFARLARERPTFALAEVDRNLTSGHEPYDLELTQRHRRAILREWLQYDPQAALAEVTVQSVSGNRAMSCFRRGMKIHALMREWGELDPEAAAAALPNLPESGAAFRRSHFAEAMLEGWHESDPAGARRWIAAQAPAEWRGALTALIDLLDSGGRPHDLFGHPDQ